MNPARRKLIEELIRVGRLIDPVLSSGNLKKQDIPTYEDILELKVDEELEDIPVMERVVDSTYTTKDMFTTDESPESNLNNDSMVSNSIAGDSDAEHAYFETSEDSSIDDITEKPRQLIPSEQVPVNELAKELVVIIEERVSKRSGEYLEDAFRDELTEAVTTQLESWLITTKRST
jgi:hypothetical protein